MKKFFIFLFVILSLSKESKAQWVTIPDANFVTWLTANYPTCMSGNQMDTTCSGIVNATGVNCQNQNISDLTGIQFFDNLSTLYCNNNLLTSLPTLPAALQNLFCYSNQLTSLPSLPNSLLCLHCGNNQITILPVLPNLLYQLICSNNQLTSLPTLPIGLLNLSCLNNQITSLPVLPNSMTYLICGGNLFSSLPALPNSLTDFNCYGCFLTSLPSLPNSLTYLDCGHNLLTSLPSLPDSLGVFFCQDNTGLVCLPVLKKITNFTFTNTGITCLPNVPLLNSFSNPSLSGFPICNLYNNAGCPSYGNIIGNVYIDTSYDCAYQTTENILNLVKVKLYQGNNLIQQEYAPGLFSFSVQNGTYTVKIDTTNFPFVNTCSSNGNCDSTLNITLNDSLQYNINFPIHCNPGFDLGVWGILCGVHPNLFPGLSPLIKISAGDLCSNYNMPCLTPGLSGQIKVVLSGPISYSSNYGTIAPNSVIDDTIIYNIQDFSLINTYNDFAFRIHTNSSAQAGQQVSVEVYVSLINGDIDTTNNHLKHYFTVSNSHDPNEKEVSPTDIFHSNQWMTYTINFQNTGTASAQHIYVDDTLDSNLDASTFQLLSYSVAPFVQIHGSNVRFNFPNINLPDSSTNEPASHGYVQYRVKTLNTIQQGDSINNTAFIYFDFNPPVVTNTTSNHYCTNTAYSFYDTLCHSSVYSFHGQNLTASGNYQATIPNSFGCDSVITLHLNVVATNPQIFLTGIDSLHTNATGHIQWIYCNGPTFPGDTLSTFIPPLEGNFAAIITNGNCVDTTNCIAVLGVNEIGNSNSSFSLFPNPANDELNISFSKKGNYTLKITDAIGREVLSATTSIQHPTFNIQHLSSGIYFVEVRGDNYFAVKKFVKE